MRIKYLLIVNILLVSFFEFRQGVNLRYIHKYFVYIDFLIITKKKEYLKYFIHIWMSYGNGIIFPYSFKFFSFFFIYIFCASIFDESWYLTKRFYIVFIFNTKFGFMMLKLNICFNFVLELDQFLQFKIYFITFSHDFRDHSLS